MKASSQFVQILNSISLLIEIDYGMWKIDPYYTDQNYTVHWIQERLMCHD